MTGEFRVFDKKNNRLIQDPVMEGLFLSCNGNLIDDNNPMVYLMNDFVVSFYIGLPDSKGTKIFEGDIITSLDRNNGKPHLVEFYKGSFVGNCGLRYFVGLEADRITVIGNKWQNPELLESK